MCWGVQKPAAGALHPLSAITPSLLRSQGRVKTTKATHREYRPRDLVCVRRLQLG